MNKVEITHNSDGSYLNLPSIPDDVLPIVTIVTPTYNRHDIFDLAIRNYLNFDYPREKLNWIILDDSPDDSLKLSLPEDKSIRYIHLDKKETIGKKRNILADKCNSKIICHMDDDDYYYPDSVKIRVISLMSYKKGVCGCIEYNCYNLVDDSQFIARGNEDDYNIGEAALCYLKDYWKFNKFNDSDTHEESIYFLKDGKRDYIDIPCIWTLLSITHGKNVSGRRNIQPVVAYSFLDLLPVSDLEYIKSMKLKLMLKDPDNKYCYELIKKLNSNNNPEKIINSLSLKFRKNVIIREYLNSKPTKSTCSDIDYLIICFPGQYVRELDFEKQDKLIEFIQSNKKNYRFTIYTNCEIGYSYNGITVSPWWKWRISNQYYKCLIWNEPSHLKLNISCKEIYFNNEYSFDVPEIKRAKNLNQSKKQHVFDC